MKFTTLYHADYLIAMLLNYGQQERGSAAFEKIGAWIILIISAFLILAMLYSLKKRDDERRKLIVMKAAMYTLYIVVGILIANIIGISITMIGVGGITNPISLLNTIAIIYFLELAYWKREYGD